MTGRKLLFAVSLLPLALVPVAAPAPNVKTQSPTQYLWYNDPFQAVVFSGNNLDFLQVTTS
ncbi:MAG: hypothetical protein WAV26_05530 [Candidatus Deferrimicrobium sp.]